MIGRDSKGFLCKTLWFAAYSECEDCFNHHISFCAIITILCLAHMHFLTHLEESFAQIKNICFASNYLSHTTCQPGLYNKFISTRHYQEERRVFNTLSTNDLVQRDSSKCVKKCISSLGKTKNCDDCTERNVMIAYWKVNFPMFWMSYMLHNI